MKLNPDNVYDSLAKDYDTILHTDPKNKIIRDYIEAQSLNYLNPTSICMDFGGGTGNDLEWFSENCFKLLFCEPSEKMRAHALKIINDKLLQNIIVIEETDFKKWVFDGKLLEKESIDFILSNFAVFNSIYEIDLLFGQLAESMKKNGMLIVCLLHGFPDNFNGIKILKRMINKFRFRMIKKSFVLKNEVHNTIIHTHPKIVSASEKQFRCLSHKQVLNSMFTLYIFQKK